MKNRIAIIEDNTMLANISKDFIESELNVDLHVFATAQSFIEGNCEAYDLIILDYNLNAYDFFAPTGEIVLKFVSALKHKPFVVLFSDLDHEQKLEELKAYGISKYLPKSENLFVELKNALQELLMLD